MLADVDATLPVRTGAPTSDIARSYLGLLVQGKSDFDAVENLRGDKFFKQALGIGLRPPSVPSAKCRCAQTQFMDRR
ncbi:hypothetical protein [Pelomonas cellulosilytica]|uniref:Uncharacterized protein n=1 Tax=Pelomonas cellulosilytica TaxID=2906762 RepID=A0ABS8XVK8_9BURK|nr:hypothetical protein [Pelomonas sp. P8]MCE4554758.1 hypothetical protein [Pelomonas sp. P8]